MSGINVLIVAELLWLVGIEGAEVLNRMVPPKHITYVLLLLKFNQFDCSTRALVKYGCLDFNNNKTAAISLFQTIACCLAKQRPKAVLPVENSHNFSYSLRERAEGGDPLRFLKRRKPKIRRQI